MKNYTVQPGDTLFGIAAREYGDGDLYPVIARQNHLANPDLILVGQELLVPYVTYRHLWNTDDTSAARAQITQHYYGTQDTKMQLIWEVASGVAQHPIERGAWLLIPDICATSGTTPWWTARASRCWPAGGTATTILRW